MAKTACSKALIEIRDLLKKAIEDEYKDEKKYEQYEGRFYSLNSSDVVFTGPRPHTLSGSKTTDYETPFEQAALTMFADQMQRLSKDEALHKATLEVIVDIISSKCGQ